jgi:hypothetical protein
MSKRRFHTRSGESTIIVGFLPEIYRNTQSRKAYLAHWAGGNELENLALSIVEDAVN